ncbi:MAG: hypothetical protein ACLGI2_14400 [Acidimicrobiia bacterium]
MRPRTIAVLIALGVVLIFGGTVAGRGGPEQEGPAALPRGSGPATTRSAGEAVSSTARSSASSSTSTSSTASTAAPFAQGRQRTDRLEREQPLARVLPHQTTHYAIDYRVAADGSLELTVRLFAVLNDVDQLAQYEEQLRRYKAEALEFIRAQGEDPGRYRITYGPPDAAAL